jgi:hypothetical protein
MVAAPSPELLLDSEEAASDIDITVHDASRLAWNVTVPIDDEGTVKYAFELELEIPSNVLVAGDPWAQLQSYARLDMPQDTNGEGLSAETIRRGVLRASSRLARVRNGFARHCAVMRANGDAQGEEGRALVLWLEAARHTLAQARTELVPERVSKPKDLDEAVEGNRSERARVSIEHERSLADEYLSAQVWALLTDCARALAATRKVFDELPDGAPALFDEVEAALVGALEGEIAYRRLARFPSAEPANARQLEHFLSRTRWLKKHFQRVLFLEAQTVQLTQRLQAWFSAAAAVMAYLWFFVWQIMLERRRDTSPSAIGSGLVAFALITSIVYASREKLKEAARDWLSGRVQRLFAQRIARYRLPRRTKKAGTVVVSARESFSQSSTERPDPLDPRSGSTVQVIVMRFSHRGVLTAPGQDSPRASQVRHVFRYDLSALFPRLHDAVKGLATPDLATRRVIITDVPRNYELPLRAVLRIGARESTRTGLVILNKNGLLRFEDDAPPPVPGLV